MKRPVLWTLLDGWFFGTAATGRGPRAVAFRMGGYAYAVIRDLIRGQMSLHASGLVYTTLLATIPLLAFMLALLKDFGARRDLRPIVFDFLSPIGPSAGQLADSLLHVADSVSGRLVGLVGLALLLSTLLSMIRSVEDGFNYVWRVERSRGLARRVVTYSALLVVGPALLLGLLAPADSALDASGVGANHLGGRLVTDLAVTVSFLLLYRFLPDTRVRWRPALLGALAAGITWALLGAVFTTLFVASSRMMIVYASFAIVVEALLWTYFGWLILLAGAQFAFYVQHPDCLRLDSAECTSPS